MKKPGPAISWRVTAKVTWFLWWRWSGLALVFTFGLFAAGDFLRFDPDRWSSIVMAMAFTAHLLLFGPFAVRAMLKNQRTVLKESFPPEKRFPKPARLDQNALALCFLTLMSFPVYEGVMEGRVSSIATAGFLSALWLLVIWYYRLGHNWARSLILFGSAICLIGPFLSYERWYDWIHSVVNAAYSAYMLYWLNTKPVREYFTGSYAVDALEVEVQPANETTPSPE